MADLFLLLPAEDGDSALYAWRERGAWRFADDLPADRPVDAPVAFIPGPAVTRHRVEITARRFSEVRQAALFAVEDDVAEPVDQIHVAVGPETQPGTGREVLVASAADMGSWIAYLSARGLGAADMVAAHSLLPADVDGLEAPDEYLVRRDGLAVSLDASLPDEVIRAIVPQAPSRILGHRLADIVGVSPDGPGFEHRQAWLEWLAESYEAGDAGTIFSLRQGAYAARRHLGLDGIRRWRLAGALAACAALLWLATIGLETAAYRDQAETLRAETQRLVDATVPSANGNADAALATLRARQQASGTGLRPTVASAALYAALGEENSAEIRSLRYDAATGELTALILISSFAEADAIGDRLEESGLGVTLGQARQSGDRVLGEFVIGAGGGS